MRLRARLVLLAVLVTALLGLGACQRETTPPLIQVRDVVPREVEEGDRITVRGEGFPEGKVAHLVFRGSLARPGTEPVTGVEVAVEGQVVSASEIEVPLTPALQRLFVGVGERAAHTTFSGELSVAFAAAVPAAPPVAGILGDVWLDVRPPNPHPAAAEAEAREGERVLAFLGLEVDPTPVAAGGLLVTTVAPGSPADAARLLPKDVITELGGVRVLTVRDLIPVPGARVAWLKIRRGGSPHEDVASVALLGLAPAPAAALLGPMLILGIAAITLVLFFAPTPPAFAWLEWRAAERILEHPDRFDGRRLVSSLGTVTAVRGYLFATSFTLLLPLVRFLGCGDLDVGMLFIVTEVALVTLGLLLGGRTAGHSYSIRRALVLVGRLTCAAIPGAVAVVAAVVSTGSLRLEDLVRSQGGWPWRWTAFVTPMGVGLATLWFVSALVQWDDDDDVVDEQRGPSSGALGLAFVVHARVVASIIAALYLGGWQVPGVAPEQLETHTGWACFGAFLFLAKSWFLALAIQVGREALPPIRAPHVVRLCVRYLTPLALVFLAVTALWVGRAPTTSAETLVGAILLSLSAATAVRAAVRVRDYLSSPRGEPDLDALV